MVSNTVLSGPGIVLVESSIQSMTSSPVGCGVLQMNISFLTVSIGSLTGSGVMLLYIHTTLKSVSEPEGLPHHRFHHSTFKELAAISPSSAACASSVAKPLRAVGNDQVLLH